MPHRMYGELAHLWPLISPPAEHAEDADRWRSELRSRLGSGRHRVLELGSGAGHTLSHLTREFQVTASDISPAMLQISQRLNPTVEHHLGDMRQLRLGRRFDAVLIHDAVNYLLSSTELEATIATARAHLRPGGLLLLNPDWFTETFPGTSVFHWMRHHEDLDLTLIEHLSDPDPADTTVESVFFYLLRQGNSLRVEQDRHLTGLFPVHTWLKLMEAGGFRASRVSYPAYDDGYGGEMLVGVLGG